MAKPLILNIPVVGITGSAGKTTTKEMTASILQQRWKVFKTKGNANTYKNTMNYVQMIQPYHGAVVLEFGMFHLGGIRKHCQIIQPNIGVITNVGTAHIGNFNGKIEGIARAKSELIQNMKQTGTLILNADDDNSRLLQTKGFRGKILTIGINKPANYQAKKVKFVNRGMVFELPMKGKVQSFYIPTFGVHNVYNALSAIAVADQLGLTVEMIKQGLQTYARPYRRLNVISLANGIKVIDDTYSANPHAMKAAIKVTTDIGNGNKIAVLGTMLEMGKYSVKAHKDVGRYIAKYKFDYLYTYGQQAKYIADGAAEAGLPRDHVLSFLDKGKLNVHLLSKIKGNTTVLVKGSHGMNMNETVQFLLNSIRK
ncbi:UDP-N-acetylmuramoyl-tripeptide--D-alanyl-D-alanine ligase [Tepidibacillus marianensis]|uniref:UDP-N-acetylmuramoyl-tripeptide--D-alanyl-D- alanine ligase n=1 Tax=Tepidibacillus marianensis TaxID=3131995 RepID=UPI0030D01F45